MKPAEARAHYDTTRAERTRVLDALSELPTPTLAEPTGIIGYLTRHLDLPGFVFNVSPRPEDWAIATSCGVYTEPGDGLVATCTYTTTFTFDELTGNAADAREYAENVLDEYANMLDHLTAINATLITGQPTHDHTLTVD